MGEAVTWSGGGEGEEMGTCSVVKVCKTNKQTYELAPTPHSCRAHLGLVARVKQSGNGGTRNEYKKQSAVRKGLLISWHTHTHLSSIMSSSLNIFVLACILSLCSCAQLQIFRAQEGGVPFSKWEAGPRLMKRSFICRDSVPSPFTIVCLPDGDDAMSATFFVDGKEVRTEGVQPFTVNGDTFATGAAPFRASAGKTVVRVRCELGNGESVESRIKFRCKGGSMPSPSPARARPSTPARSPRPSVPAHKTDPKPATGGSGGCVVVKGGSFVGGLSKGWTKDVGNSVSYKIGDRSGGIAGKGSAPVKYEFVAPETSRFAFTIDMTTRHGVDHNDVWVEFPSGGWGLNRSGDPQKRAVGWTKAYHNANGRAAKAFSIDFRAHYFSTWMTLKKGDKYVVRVGGRSTRVTVHNLVLFPCTGMGCKNFDSKANACLK